MNSNFHALFSIVDDGKFNIQTEDLVLAHSGSYPETPHDVRSHPLRYLSLNRLH